MAERFATYAEFWPHYLREHSRSETRWFHYFGTGLAILCVVFALTAQAWWYLAFAFVAGYGPAWFSHAMIERNRPATFTHPWWSLISDFRMYFLAISGKLGRELARHQIET